MRQLPLLFERRRRAERAALLRRWRRALWQHGRGGLSNAGLAKYYEQARLLWPRSGGTK